MVIFEFIEKITSSFSRSYSITLTLTTHLIN